MSIIGSNILAGSSGQGGAYEIEQSLRFDGGAYLNRTPSSAGNRKTWTWSGWVKRWGLGELEMITICKTTGTNYSQLYFSSSDNIVVDFFNSGSQVLSLTTNQVFRDPSAWMHVVFALDTTNGTASDRFKLYVNGLQVTSFSTSSYPSQNTDCVYNTANQHDIGYSSFDSSYGQKAYLAELNFIDGSALDPTSFGEYDDNGVWRPIKYAGSYTGNSFYLKFAGGDGTDSSGLSNTWTANNFTTSGTGTDVMSDTPTTNYCTLNPLDIAGSTQFSLSNGNLDGTLTNTSQTALIVATQYVSSGKWYAEFTPTVQGANSVITVGVQKNVLPRQPYVGGDTNSYGYRQAGIKIHNAVSASYGASYTTGDVIGVALDLDAGTLTFYKNGSSQGQAYSGLSGEYTFAYTDFGNGTFTANFGQRAFAYTPPTGFKSLNTSNLPAPTIKDGSKYFNTVLYSGNGTSQSLTVGFQPDWIWTKPRNATGAHVLVDAVRGNTKFLESNSTGAEQTRTGNDGVTSFDTNGYSIGSSADWNASSETFVSWNWLAGGSGSSNTDGSITSTVSVNASAGFSIVSFNSGASGAKTVGHGLGVAPQWIITKDRDNATNWTTYHASATTATDKYINLNGVAGVQTASGIWGSTLPTSTVFGFGSGTASAPNADCIAYCFAEVEGYSKFGSFTANNSANGPFVYCGFKPAWFIIKGTVGNTLWGIFDVARNTYNPLTQGIFQDSSAEAALGNFDFLSNGFKIRTTAWNDPSFGAIIFAAFAENPFGGSGVSPATAR